MRSLCLFDFLAETINEGEAASTAWRLRKRRAWEVRPPWEGSGGGSSVGRLASDSRGETIALRWMGCHVASDQGALGVWFAPPTPEAVFHDVSVSSWSAVDVAEVRV